MKRKTLSMAIGFVLLSPVAWAQDAATQANEPASNPKSLDAITVAACKLLRANARRPCKKSQSKFLSHAYAGLLS